MLKLDTEEQIEGETVFHDDTQPFVYYVLPSQPRYRLEAGGKPMLNFLKYKMPIDRPDGRVGGGYVFFDVEFTVPEAKETKIRQILQDRINQKFPNMNPRPQLQLRSPTYAPGGTSSLLLQKDGVLIENVASAGSPSMYGKNISTFAVELSPQGATFFEDALQGIGGGVVNVVYNLKMKAQLPPLTAKVWFRAEQMYSFFQKVDVDWKCYGSDSYRETLRERIQQSEAAGVDINPGSVTDQKVIESVRTWALQNLDELLKNKIEAIAPVGADGRKMPEGIEHLTRDVFVSKMGDFTRTYKERQVVDYPIHPQGIMPNITSLPNVKWADHARVIDLRDPFFQQLHVDIWCNCDFAALPVNSVDVHLEYKSGKTQESKGFRFTKPDDVGHFKTFMENGQTKYKYWFEVNYKGQSRSFKSKVQEAEHDKLEVNVGDLGIWMVDVFPGDISFDQVKQALVTLQYTDTGVPLVEQRFSMDRDHQEFHLAKVTFQPRTKPYRVKVKYFMTDGKEFEADWVECNSQQFYVNDPFSATRTLTVQGLGDFENEVDAIFVDLDYVDSKNKYTQSKSGALTMDQPFFEWSFPVINETGGKLTYSANIRNKDGTVSTVPVTEATSNTLLVGKKAEEVLPIQVIADLVNFDEVRLCKVALRYEDISNAVNLKKDIIFKPGGETTVEWKVALKNKANNSYKWQATFFLMGGMQKATAWETTNEPTIVLETPAE